MNSIKNQAEIKAYARTHLEGCYLIYMLIFIIYTISVVLLSQIAVDENNRYKLLIAITNFVISVFTGILVAMFKGGLCNVSVKICAGDTPVVKDLFYNYIANSRNSFFTYALPVFIQNLFLIPAYTYIFRYGADRPADLFKVLILSGIGFVGYYLVTLGFFPVYYLFVDFPEKTPKEIIKLSFWLMKGHKIRLLLLEMSFIPIFIISMFTMGIGLLWVVPYYQTSLAYFYMNLLSNRTGTESD